MKQLPLSEIKPKVPSQFPSVHQAPGDIQRLSVNTAIQLQQRPATSALALSSSPPPKNSGKKKTTRTSRRKERRIQRRTQKSTEKKNKASTNGSQQTATGIKSAITQTLETTVTQANRHAAVSSSTTATLNEAQRVTSIVGNIQQASTSSNQAPPLPPRVDRSKKPKLDNTHAKTSIEVQTKVTLPNATLPKTTNGTNATLPKTTNTMANATPSLPRANTPEIITYERRNKGLSKSQRQKEIVAAKAAARARKKLKNASNPKSGILSGLGRILSLSQYDPQAKDRKIQELTEQVQKAEASLSNTIEKGRANTANKTKRLQQRNRSTKNRTIKESTRFINLTKGLQGSSTNTTNTPTTL
jgi:hypothetical protein